MGDPRPSGRARWKDVAALGLLLNMHEEWDSFISRMCKNHIILDDVGNLVNTERGVIQCWLIT
jgi:hypothetical protein